MEHLKLKIFFAVWVLISSIIISTVQAQNKKKTTDLDIEKQLETLDEINKRLDVLEGQKENINKQNELLKVDFELKAKSLDTKFSEHKIEINKDISGVRSLMYTLGIGVLGLLITYWVYFKDFVKKKSEDVAEKIINEKITTIIEVNKEKIIALIRDQDIEKKLKENSKILTVVESEEDKNYMELLFLEIGFLNVVFHLGGSYEAPDNDINLIIFDDHKLTKQNHALFEEYMNQLIDRNILFVFYGDRFNVQNREKLNFANTKYTLYNQMLNSLKYTEISKQ